MRNEKYNANNDSKPYYSTCNYDINQYTLKEVNNLLAFFLCIVPSPLYKLRCKTKSFPHTHLPLYLPTTPPNNIKRDNESQSSTPGYLCCTCGASW